MILNLEQGSESWKEARLGMCTASRFGDILPGARGYRKSRDNYLYELVAERLTGASKTFRESVEMAHGNEFEDEARSSYSFITGNNVTEIGIAILDDNNFIGASPDGLVDSLGGIEIKCFDTKKHISIIINGMPPEIMPQIQGNIWINNLKWIDFVSYDPRIKSDKNIYIQRINRDDEYIDKLKNECFKFTDEIEKITRELG